MKTRDFRHPREEQAMLAIQRSALFGGLSKAMTGLLVGTPALAESVARRFPVTRRTHPRLFELYRQTLERLDIAEPYPLFLEFAYPLRAQAQGHGKSCVLTLTSSCLELFSDEQLRAVLGHELAHVKYDHLRYFGLFKAMETVGKFSFSLVDAGMNALVSPFLEWMQAADYTADRAAAHAAGSREAVVEVIRCAMGADPAIPGLHPVGVPEQAPAPQKLEDMTLIGKILLERLMLEDGCPWGAERIRELLEGA